MRRRRRSKYDTGLLGGAAKAVVEKLRGEEFVAKWNMPGMTPKEVQLAMMLVSAGHALTRVEWLKMANLSPGKNLKCGGATRRKGQPRRIYINELVKAGYVTRIKRNKPLTGARIPDLYLPTLKLLSALADAVSEQSQPLSQTA